MSIFQQIPSQNYHFKLICLKLLELNQCGLPKCVFTLIQRYCILLWKGMVQDPVKARTVIARVWPSLTMPVFILISFLICSKPGAVCAGFNYLNSQTHCSLQWFQMSSVCFLSSISWMLVECSCARLCCAPEMFVVLGKSTSVTISQGLISPCLCGICLKVLICPHCDGTTCLCCQFFRFYMFIIRL